MPTGVAPITTEAPDRSVRSRPSALCDCRSCPKYATTGDEAGEAVGVRERVDGPMSDAAVPSGMMDTVRTAAADRRHDAV